MKRRVGFLAALCLGLAGCGSGSGGGIAVTGTVTLDDTPLSGAEVNFRPANEKTGGLGGSGLTDADGKYTITGARGEKGLLPGEYTVVISRRLRPDGSPADPKVPPIESDARETLPLRYSDLQQSTLRATVSKEKPVHDFPLKKDRK